MDNLTSFWQIEKGFNQHDKLYRAPEPTLAPEAALSCDDRQGRGEAPDPVSLGGRFRVGSGHT